MADRPLTVFHQQGEQEPALSVPGARSSLSGRLQDQLRYYLGLRDQREVTRLRFDRLGAHPLRHEALEIRVNGPVLRRHRVKTRLRPPRRMGRLALKQLARERTLNRVKRARPHRRSKQRDEGDRQRSNHPSSKIQRARPIGVKRIRSGRRCSSNGRHSAATGSDTKKNKMASPAETRPNRNAIRAAGSDVSQPNLSCPHHEAGTMSKSYFRPTSTPRRARVNSSKKMLFSRTGSISQSAAPRKY
jgi:hypothetical protein